MKTDSKTLATFLAAAVWADGEYDEFEKEFVADLSSELEMKNLNADLGTAIQATEKLDEEGLATVLEETAKKVDASEKKGILSLCLQLMCADAFLSSDEIENHFAFADILGIDEDAAQVVLDELVEDEENLIIEE